MRQTGPTKVELRIPTDKPKFRRPGYYMSRDPKPDRLPILALDPGGTTGWSLLVLPTEIDGRDTFSHTPHTILQSRLIWEHGEFPTLGAEDEAVYQLARLAGGWPDAAIVVEDFILRVERKEKSRELLSPVRITAKFETYLWREDRSMFLQDPSQGKRVTDDRLDLLDAKVDDGLEDHARDADRHAVMFMKRCIGIQGAQLKISAWPQVYATGKHVVVQEESEAM